MCVCVDVYVEMNAKNGINSIDNWTLCSKFNKQTNERKIQMEIFHEEPFQLLQFGPYSTASPQILWDYKLLTATISFLFLISQKADSIDFDYPQQQQKIKVFVKRESNPLNNINHFHLALHTCQHTVVYSLLLLLLFFSALIMCVDSCVSLRIDPFVYYLVSVWIFTIPIQCIFQFRFSARIFIRIG